MNATVGITVVAIIAVLGIGYLVGRLIMLRSTLARAAAKAAQVDTSGLGLSDAGPTLVLFCAPASAEMGAEVRRVIDEVCTETPGVAHLEIDPAADPETARRLSVSAASSEPVTILFDREGHPRYRTLGVPHAGDLRTALKPLLA